MNFYSEALNQYFGPGCAFALGDKQYPPNWLEFATPEEIAAIGLVPVVTVGERLDDTLYDVSEVLDGPFLRITSTLKPRHIPQSVSRFQARAALLQAGLLDDIETYMADPATDAFTRLAWTDAQEFNRSSPLVASIGGMFGMTNTQLDDLFVFASTITA